MLKEIRMKIFIPSLWCELEHVVWALLLEEFTSRFIIITKHKRNKVRHEQMK